MRWAVLGDIPERINSKAEKAKSQSVDRISFFNSMSIYDFSPEEIDKMISITNDMLKDIVSDKKIQKLANKLAIQTGMRASEIRGLRICDIHAEGIIVDHAWDRYARANKCCKNGESRQIPIPISKELREELLFLGKLNPFCETDKAYIFCSDKSNSPMDNSGWVKYLRRALEKFGYESPNDIVFHSWRHFFCSRMLDVIPDK